jgi:predicted alpha-1,2-mannosidase
MRMSAAVASAAVALVNPLIGTASKDPNITRGGGAGATVPGAATPFGLVQMSPETAPARDAFGAGYAYADRRIRGFSPTHVSGTGCAVFGDVPVLPVAGAPTRPTTSPFTHAHESAAAGAYDVTLAPGTSRAVHVALGATTRVGVLRVRFPPGRPATLLVDAGGSQMGDDRAAVRLDPRAGTFTATATSGRFCGADNTYILHVAGRLSVRPRSWGTWSDGLTHAGATRAQDARTATGARPVPGGLPVSPVRGADAGAYLRFAPGSTVELRMGVSFVDAAGARANLAAEAPPRRDLTTIRRTARAAWAAQLRRIPATGASDAQRTVLATALYHALLHPNVIADVDGRYPGLDGRVATAHGWSPRSTIAGWDSYRTQFPLLALRFPSQARDVALTLLDDARRAPGGCLPRFALAGDDAGAMVGSPGAILLAEAVAFRVPGIGAAPALAAARRALEPPCRDARPAAAVENAVADAAVAHLARAAGEPAVAAALDARATAAWTALDLAHADPASTANLVEGTAAQYAFALSPAAPADGATAALARLRATLARVDGGPFAPVAGLGNEPSFGLPWVGAALGDPATTRDAVARGLALFRPTPDGLPGNEDAGALSAWWILAALGRYPLTPGSAALTATTPLLR